MANQEHLDLLIGQGVEVWNQWRQENPDLEPDLSGAILNRANLSGALLSRTNLTEASLIWADLSGAILNEARLDEAILTEANLTGATLSGATLDEADLRQASLHNADLRGATLIWALLSGADLSGTLLSNTNLSGASLDDANLSRADLSGADLKAARFNGARLAFTIFGRIDLSVAKGLDMVQHLGPSIIDIGTISLSRGSIPEIFLRGAGVPDPFIGSQRSLAWQSADCSLCLLRCTSEDQAFAERLHADLQNRGIRCWIVPRGSERGMVVSVSNDEVLRFYDKLVLVLSEHTVASHWVQHEVEVALSKELNSQQRFLYPIRLDKAVLDSTENWAIQLQHRSIADFSRWKEHDAYQKAFTQLLRELKAVTTPAGI
jgi:uncharacterized protein YjbI with pentapeptide repeats